MSIEQEQAWITGEELGKERRRLIEAGVPDDAPEPQALWGRLRARDDYLFGRYGREYLLTHPGKWIAISLTGRVLIRNTAGELVWAAAEAFGDGTYCSRKLADFPGHQTFSDWRPATCCFRRDQLVDGRDGRALMEDSQ